MRYDNMDILQQIEANMEAGMDEDAACRIVNFERGGDLYD